MKMVPVGSLKIDGNGFVRYVRGRKDKKER